MCELPTSTVIAIVSLVVSFAAFWRNNVPHVRFSRQLHVLVVHNRSVFPVFVSRAGWIAPDLRAVPVAVVQRSRRVNEPDDAGKVERGGQARIEMDLGDLLDSTIEKSVGWFALLESGELRSTIPWWRPIKLIRFHWQNRLRR